MKRRFVRFGPIVVLAAGLLFGASCGGSTSGGDGNNPPKNPYPEITSISPTSATASGAAFAETVTGTGFVSTSTVDWNGSARVTTYVSPTQLNAAITAADIAAAGTATVTVFNIAPGGGTSNGQGFTINNPAGRVISSLSPSVAYIPIQGVVPLTIYGLNFQKTDQVIIGGGVPAQVTTVASSSKITTQLVLSGMYCNAGGRNVTVCASDGSGCSPAAVLSIFYVGGTPLAAGSGNQEFITAGFDSEISELNSGNLSTFLASIGIVGLAQEGNRLFILGDGTGIGFYDTTTGNHVGGVGDLYNSVAVAVGNLCGIIPYQAQPVLSCLQHVDGNPPPNVTVNVTNSNAGVTMADIGGVSYAIVYDGATLQLYSVVPSGKTVTITAGPSLQFALSSTAGWRLAINGSSLAMVSPQDGTAYLFAISSSAVTEIGQIDGGITAPYLVAPAINGFLVGGQGQGGVTNVYSVTGTTSTLFGTVPIPASSIWQDSNGIGWYGSIDPQAGTQVVDKITPAS